MESLKDVLHQAAEVCNALEESTENIDDAQAKSNADPLVSQIRDYKFLVSLVLWYSLLFWVKYVSKEFQNDTMDVAAGLSSFQKFCNWLKTYKEKKSFNEALIDANELAKDLDAEPLFKSRVSAYGRKKKIMNLQMNLFRIQNQPS